MAETDSIAAEAAPDATTKWPKKNPEPHKRACIKYERKSKKGFLMRAYRNMQSRVTGIQSNKHHLYEGKELLSREDFYQWSLADPDFNRLFDAWLAEGHPRRTCPSVDRENSEFGYVFGNIRWITFSENCRNIRRTIRPHGRPRKASTQDTPA